MNIFNFVPMSQAEACIVCKWSGATALMMTRIRIEGDPCCERHMPLRLRECARQRLAKAARCERDRRRVIRREAEERRNKDERRGVS